MLCPTWQLLFDEWQHCEVNLAVCDDDLSLEAVHCSHPWPLGVHLPTQTQHTYSPARQDRLASSHAANPDTTARCKMLRLVSLNQNVQTLKRPNDTHTPLDLVFDGFNDASVSALTQPLCRLEVLGGHLHFLLLERHHRALQSRARQTTLVMLRATVVRERITLADCARAQRKANLNPRLTRVKRAGEQKTNVASRDEFPVQIKGFLSLGKSWNTKINWYLLLYSLVKWSF